MWWSQAGSNRRPPACKAGALPAELWPRDLSFFGLALLQPSFSQSCTRLYTPSFIRPAPRQLRKTPASLCYRALAMPEKILRYLCSFQPRSCAIFVGSRRNRVTFIAINERGSNKEPAKMVGLGRFELPTSPLSGVRSNQLSYRPLLVFLVHRFVGCSLAAVMYIFVHSLARSQAASR